MNPSLYFERVVRFAATRPIVVLAVTAALALGGGALAALTLHPSAGTDTLAGRSSPTAKATADFHRNFGDESIVILVREHLPELVGSSDLGRLIELEYCLSGQRAPGFPQVFSPGDGTACDQLGRSKAVKAVYGPGTFLKKSVDEVRAGIKAQALQTLTSIQTAGAAAAQAARKQGLPRAQQLAAAQAAANQTQALARQKQTQIAVQTGLTSIPAIDNPQFVNKVVFDPMLGNDVPKGRFSYLFPNPNAALIQVRLQPGLSDAQRKHTIALVEQAVKLPDPATGQPRFALAFGGRHGGTYTVTGLPVVIAGVADKITSEIVKLLIAALLIMLATLAIVFRTRLRLLPLAVALAAAGLTFGAMALAGVSLTMAAVAVLPVLIGLGVDYAIQFQTRVDEADDTDRAEAVVAGARAGVPTIATAALATGVGFLVLALSPVPMVRGFGLLLVLGIVLALACTLTAGAAALSLGHRRGPSKSPVAAAARGASELIDHGWRRLIGGTLGRILGSAGSRALLISRSQPQRVLAVGLALAVLGWALDTQTHVVSDIQRLVPQDLTELRNLKTLERETGVSGEIDVTVSARDVTDPAVVRWMTSYQQGVLAQLGYRDGTNCRSSKICPALSLPALFNSGTGAPDATAIRARLASVPPYFSQAVITPDHREANLAFGIKQMPLDEQQKVIDVMRKRLDPPPGVSARLAGLPVLASEANDKLASPARRLLTLLAGLLAVGLALFAVFRRAERAAVPLVPIALATGWSSLLLFVMRVPLNPLSATLGALVIAISTEFSVLLCERYRQEREAGHEEQAALERTYRSTGAAVLASGVTAIIGFGVLGISDIAMLRNFGLVTAVDLTVSLLGVLFVLPAVLRLAERGELLTAPRQAWRAIAEKIPAGRRRSPAGMT